MSDAKPAIPQVSPWIGQEEVSATLRVLESGWITEGRFAEDFLQGFQTLVGYPGVLAPNGTLAISLALTALGLKRGDEVLIPDTTFFGTATAIMGIDAVPVPVDVDPTFFMTTAESYERAITPKTRAIVPVHLYGNPCEIGSIMDLASQYNLKVVEDAAQGVGVRISNQHVGSFGDASAFSFFADKTITMGEGGFVGARDEETRDRLAYLRNQGRLGRGSFIHPEYGMNFRITDIQAAIGLAQLGRLPEIISRKRLLWERYRQNLEGLESVRLVTEPVGAESVPFRAVIEVPNKSRCIEELEHEGVVVREVFYPISQQPGLKKWLGDRDLLERTEERRHEVSIRHYETCLCLPIHATMTEYEVDRVCEAVRAGQ